MNEDDDEEEEEFDIFKELCSEKEKGKSAKGRRPKKEQDHAAGHNKLMEDYFVPQSTYGDRDSAFCKLHVLLRKPVCALFVGCGCHIW
ncbi:hypothetical protein VP01_14428g1, partial [Puccinia sorghi]